MTFSYDNTDLGTDTSSGRLNAVRLLIGDTLSSDQQIQNEEITFALTQTGDNVYYAAAWVSRTIASKYARYVDTDLDGELSEKYSQLQKHYSTLANQLEYQGKKSGNILGAAVGGVSLAAMQAVVDNTDRVKSRIQRDQFRIDTEVSDYYEGET